MSATQDLIAAALRLAALAERNTDCRDEWQEAIDSVREACAREMVQPDIAEVERLVCIHENVVRMDATGMKWGEGPSATRTALLDYVRDHFGDADKMVQPVGELPIPAYDGYDMIDRFIRNNLDDDDYAEYLSGLHEYGDAREAAGYAAGVVAAEARADETRRLYNELLHQVGMKYPGETRHETAIRYLRVAEIHVCGPAVAALRGEVKP